MKLGKSTLETRTLIAIIGTATGGIGIYVALARQYSERPNIFLRGPTAIFVASGLEITALPGALAAIEEQFGEVTANHVTNLRDETLALRPSDTDFTTTLDTLRFNLQKAIRFFDQPGQEWAIDDIAYEDGVITWPDGTTLDLNDPLDSFMIPLPAETLARAREGKDKDAVQKVIEFSYEIFRPWHEDYQSQRASVARELRQIRTSVDDFREDQAKRIRVDVTVENRSRLPTVVKKGAVLRVYKDAQQFKDVPLQLAEAAVLDALSITSLTLESNRLGLLDEDTRQFLVHAYEREYAFVVFVEDLHGKLWFELGSFSALERSVLSPDLVRKLDIVFQKLDF